MFDASITDLSKPFLFKVFNILFPALSIVISLYPFSLGVRTLYSIERSKILKLSFSFL